MIKTIIVDDEYNSRDFLEKMLAKHFPDKFLILAKCETVDEALKVVDEYQPDLVFLDIQMSPKNGFDFVKEIKNYSFEIIFTTAFSEFAIKAIKLSALDYLLKPINYIDLLEAVNKFDNKFVCKKEQNRLKLLIENLDSGDVEYKKIALPTESGFEIARINSILYCEADGNYCKIHFIDGNMLILSKTLKYIEEQLPDNIFCRIHKSFLVNLNFIKRFIKGAENLVELVDGSTLFVSIRKKEELINVLLKK